MYMIIVIFVTQISMASLPSAALQASHFNMTLRHRSYSCGSTDSESSPPVSPTTSK